MDVDRVRDELTGTRFADVRWVARTGSTNSDVLDLGRQGEPEGIVVVADHQTAGRGRRGRSWQARPGDALMATVLLRPKAGEEGATTMAVAVAAAEAVEARAGVAPRLKWPNDLVWPGDGSGPDRKLAGILAEAEGGAVAVGIGLNVRWSDGVPDELADLAVAVDDLGGARVTREDLLVALLQALDGAYGAADLRGRWVARSATLGRAVRVDLGAEELVGTAVDLSVEGHLVVEMAAGERVAVAVGDVVHLR